MVHQDRRPEGTALECVQASDERVTIDTPGRAESLNVVVATGVILDRMIEKG